ncbi:hypothetical protein [Leifsonia sp. NPDC058248]
MAHPRAPPHALHPPRPALPGVPPVTLTTLDQNTALVLAKVSALLASTSR